MIRKTAILVFCFLTTSVYSQKTYDCNFYLNATIGFGVPLKNSDARFNGLKMDYSGLFFDKGSAYIKVKNNFGVHLNFTGVGYWYDMHEKSIIAEYPNYYLWDKLNSYGNVKFSFLAGLAYKFHYKRFVAIPFLDLGFIPYATSKLDSYTLKEKNSNNIRQVRNSSRLHCDRFDYTLGADLYFHLGQNWGIATTIQYDRFSATTNFTTTVTDYYPAAELKQTETVKFKQKNILVSFGVFMSLFNNKVENNSK